MGPAKRQRLLKSSYAAAHGRFYCVARRQGSQNKLPTTAQPSISTRHALPDAHGYKLHRTSTHARRREDSHPNTFVRRPRRGVGAAHAVPPPAHTARAVPDRNRTNERTTEGSPCLRWPGRAFARGARGKLAQVKLNYAGTSTSTTTGRWSDPSADASVRARLTTTGPCART